MRRTAWSAAAVAALAVVLSAGPASATDDITPPAAFDMVADAGAYQSGYSVASPYTSVYVTWEATTDEQSAVTYELTVDGDVARVVTDPGDGTTITKRVEIPDGLHVVGVRALDRAGNVRPATHSLDVVIDRVDPWFTSKPQLLLRRGPVTDAGYPMRYTWSGADEGTGLAAVLVGPNRDCCYTLAPTATQFDFSVPPVSQVVWRLWLVDGVGRVVKAPRSGYVDTAPWSRTQRSDGWRRLEGDGALDGWEWVSTHHGDRLSITVAGESIGWVSSTGPHRGRADVMIGSTVVDTVDLRSRARRPARVVWTAPLSPRHPSRVTIVNRSPRGRTTIGVDAVLVQT